jgi:ribosomal protein S18 acetylase RimI-like enzyme
LFLNAAFEKIKTEEIIEIIYLMVRADNIPSIKLYKQKGFDFVAELEKDTKIGSKYYTENLMCKFA